MKVPRAFVKTHQVLDVNHTFPFLDRPTRDDQEFLFFGDARPFVTAIYENPHREGRPTSPLVSRTPAWVGNLGRPRPQRIAKNLILRSPPSGEIPLFKDGSYVGGLFKKSPPDRNDLARKRWLHGVEERSLRRRAAH